MATGPARVPVTTETATVRVAMDGPAITNDYPLEEVSAVLYFLSRLTRNAAIINSTRIRQEHSYGLRADFPRKGSYQLAINLIVTVAGTTGTVALTAGLAKNVMETAKSAIELFRALVGEKGKARLGPPDNSGNQVVHSGTGNISVNQFVINTAAVSAADLAELVGRLNRTGVETLKLTGVGQGDLILTSSDARALKAAGIERIVRAAKKLKKADESKLPDALPEGIVEIDGDLVSFNKKGRRGKIEVTGGAIRPGTYRFQLIDASIENAVMGMLHSRLRIRCYITRLRSSVRLDVVGIEAVRALGAM